MDQPIFSPYGMHPFGHYGAPPNMFNFNEFNPFDPAQNFRPPQNIPSPHTQNVPSPHTQNVPDSPTEEEESEEPDEVVPETQPNEVDKKTTRAANRNWEPAEERELARAWVDISENEAQGNAVSARDFWKFIHRRFLRGMKRGDYRTKDQIYSKWGKTNKVVQEFNGIYNNLKREWKSGESDDIILQNALAIFHSDHKTGFTHMEFWNVVRFSAKWKDVHASTFHTRGPKRSKTSESSHTVSSDARVGIDLNDSEAEETSPPPPERPMGRDAAKRKAKGKGIGSSSDDIKGLTDEVTVIRDQLSSFFSYQKTKDERRERDRAMRIFMQDVSHLPPAQFETAIAMKEELKKKWGF